MIQNTLGDLGTRVQGFGPTGTLATDWFQEFGPFQNIFSGFGFIGTLETFGTFDPLGPPGNKFMSGCWIFSTLVWAA